MVTNCVVAKVTEESVTASTNSSGHLIHPWVLESRFSIDCYVIWENASYYESRPYIDILLHIPTLEKNNFFSGLIGADL